MLSKFFWAVKTFGGPASVDAFCRLYELHPQGRKVRFADEDEVFSAQSGCCTFVPRRPNKSQRIERVELSYCQKNRWDDDWTEFWFYAKIGFPNADGTGEVSYPLASKVLPVEHISQADFRRSAAGYKDCVGAFGSAAGLIGGRDLIEEFICANIWPLSAGWDPNPLAKVKVRALKESVPFLKLELVKPPGKSDKAIVAEVEDMAVELAGPYLLKEHESLLACCSSGSRVNRSFAVMGVKYPDRVEPKKPEKRSKGTSSEDPAAKKRKVSSADAEAPKADPKVSSSRLPRPPPKVPSTKKGNHLV